MDLSVITVTWNSASQIAEQISSVILGCKDLSFEQTVVDSGSSDDTINIVTSRFPQVKAIVSERNIGFAAGNNLAAKNSSGEFLLFLNADMKVEPGSLDKIVGWMREHRDVGIVSCKLVDSQGNFNWEAAPRRLPRVWEQIAIILKLPHVFPKMLNKYHMRNLDIDKEQEVDSVRGSFLILRRDVVEQLGWAFDPRYFIWYEDVDICREVKKLGYKVMYSPIISCVDYVGQSFKNRRTVWKQKQFTKSMLQYFRKWEPWWRWLPIMLTRPIGITFAWIGSIARGESRVKN